MDKLDELKNRKKDIFKQIEKLNAFQYEVYENFLREKGLDKDVELRVCYRGKIEWKKGRIIICEGYGYIANYVYEFHAYTKQGALSKIESGYVNNPEKIDRLIKGGELRAVK